jgi:nucleotide-binding universal stress UspA family protein
MPFASILVAYDGSDPARQALAEAVDLGTRSDAALTIVCVVPVMIAVYGIAMPPGETVAKAIESAREMLATVKLDLVHRGHTKVETVLLEGDPVDRILEYARHHPPDLIVVGSRGLSEAGRFFLGSVSDGILHHAHGSVLVVKSAAHSRSAGASRAI